MLLILSWFVLVVMAFLIWLNCREIKKYTRSMAKRSRKKEIRENMGDTMSKIFTDNIGKKCYIRSMDSRIEQRLYTILEADEEWVKVSCRDVADTSERKTKIMRIDAIEEIELVEPKPKTEQKETI